MLISTSDQAFSVVPVNKMINEILHGWKKTVICRQLSEPSSQTRLYQSQCDKHQVTYCHYQ